MNGREEELVYLFPFVECVSGFGLRATNDPKTRGFRFFEGVLDTANKRLYKTAVKNYLNAPIRRAFAPMNNLRSQGIMQTQVHLV